MTADEVLARHWATITKLSDTERAAALRMFDRSLSMSAREAAVQQMVDSSDNSRDHLAAVIDLFNADRPRNSTN